MCAVSMATVSLFLFDMLFEGIVSRRFLCAGSEVDFSFYFCQDVRIILKYSFSECFQISLNLLVTKFELCIEEQSEAEFFCAVGE